MTSRLRNITVLVSTLLLSVSLNSCSLHKYPLLDTRTTKGVLAKYEKTAYPKDVIRFLFRHGRLTPERDELLIVAEWSIDHRIKFIRLLDKMAGEYRENFISEFSDILSSSELRTSFEEEFRTSAAPSVKEIILQLQKSGTNVASSAK